MVNASTLSVNDHQVTDQIKMFPNPVKDILTVKNIRNNVKLIQVYTIDGRKLLEKVVDSNETEMKLDMSRFANGTYVLKASDGQSNQTKMIMVSH